MILILNLPKQWGSLLHLVVLVVVLVMVLVMVLGVVLGVVRVVDLLACQLRFVVFWPPFDLPPWYARRRPRALGPSE